jgi:hypothetical protein
VRESNMPGLAEDPAVTKFPAVVRASYFSPNSRRTFSSMMKSFFSASTFFKRLLRSFD